MQMFGFRPTKKSSTEGFYALIQLCDEIQNTGLGSKNIFLLKNFLATPLAVALRSCARKLFRAHPIIFSAEIISRMTIQVE